VISPDKAMLFQDAAIVVLFVAPGLAAIYWLRRLRLFSRWRLRGPRAGVADAVALAPPALRKRHAPAEACPDAPVPGHGAEVALSAERVRGLQTTAEEQLDAAQYALKRLVLDLQGVMPVRESPPPVVVRLPEPQQPPKDQALAA
jgi:hypothetical protein